VCGVWHVLLPAGQQAVPSHSQPSSALGDAGMAQLACTPEQVELQTPALHEGVATLDAEHTRPHFPQLPESVLKSASQPLFSLPSQLPCVKSHEGTQPPVVPLKVQALVPPTCWHTVPHPPQLDVVVRSTVQPRLGLPPHASCVESHDGTQPPVVPLKVQALVPPTCWHTVPHPPQLDVVVSSVSQPFEAIPSQSPKPGVHASVQSPLHVPLMGRQQVVPQICEPASCA
jgi:hypothetical protein